MNGLVSVTGIGLICAIGNDTHSVLESLQNKYSGIVPVKYLRTMHQDIPVGEVKLSTSQMKATLGIEEKRPVSRTSVLGAIAVREALHQAGISDIGKKRVALISGTTVGVMDLTEEYFERRKTDPTLEYLPHSNECGTSTKEIAEFAGIPNARCCTICTACSSALNAVMIGADMLQNDEVDVVVAGGSEPLSRYHLNGFNSLMILDRERCRPFDESRAGLNLGEGAGYVVLQKNAPDSLAYIAGYANRCDAFHQTATSPQGEGAFLAMTGALKMAGIQPGDIKYVNAHGTATLDNDASESAAFVRVFGDNLPPISSTKAYTGHTTSAAGAVETVICILAMQHHFIPASLGWSHAFLGGIVPSQGASGAELDYVMCNSFGFGGNDSSLILSLHKPTQHNDAQKNSAEIKTVACVSVSKDEDLVRLKDYLSMMDTRRMGKLMKACLLSAFEALKQADISVPDAIVTSTSEGMLEFSTRFLNEICTMKESMLKPTLFMQSTHNTIGSAIAIRTKCHGYNITYSQGCDSLCWAERDARRLIERGEAGTVLVCDFDEKILDDKTSDFRAVTTIFTSDK